MLNVHIHFVKVVMENVVYFYLNQIIELIIVEIFVEVQIIFEEAFKTKTKIYLKKKKNLFFSYL